MSDWAERIREAYAALRSGDAQTARTLLESESGERPASGDFALAQAYAQLQQWSAAVELLWPLWQAGQLPAQAVSQLALLLNNQASSELRAGDLDVADEHLRKALQLDPSLPQALFNAASLARRRNQPHRAGELLARLSDDARDADSETLQAWTDWRLGDPGAAIRRLASLPADSALGLHGELALATGDGDGGRDKLRRAYSQTPSLRGLLRAELTMQVIYDDAAERKRERQAYAEGLERVQQEIDSQPLLAADADGADCHNPGSFYLAYQGEDDRELQERSAAVLQACLHDQHHASATPSPIPKRLVVVSSFLRDCTVGHYFQAWWPVLAKAGFDLHFVQLEHPVDAFSAGLRQHGALHDLSGLQPASAVRQRLLELRPDTLLYPEIGMHAPTRWLAAQRLAPLQLGAWGHPVTSGLATIDRFLSVAAMEPAGASAHYSEQLIELPGLGSRFRRAEAAPMSRGQLGLPDDKHRLFLLPHNSFKIGPELDDAVATILRADARHRLVTVAGSDPDHHRLLLARWHRRLGDRAQQIITLPAMPREAFVALCAAADVAVDAWPFSAGNVALDCLGAGTPMVSCPGHFMRGRQTAAMLHRVGCAEALVDTPEQLGDHALALSADETLRARLQQASGRLFDSEEWHEDLIQACERHETS